MDTKSGKRWAQEALPKPPPLLPNLITELIDLILRNALTQWHRGSCYKVPVEIMHRKYNAMEEERRRGEHKERRRGHVIGEKVEEK